MVTVVQHLRRQNILRTFIPMIEKGVRQVVERAARPTPEISDALRPEDTPSGTSSGAYEGMVDHGLFEWVATFDFSATARTIRRLADEMSAQFAACVGP